MNAKRFLKFWKQTACIHFSFSWMQHMGVSNTVVFLSLKDFFQVFQSSETWTRETSFSIYFSRAWVAGFAMTVVGWIWWHRLVAPPLLYKDLQSDSCEGSDFGGAGLKLDLTQTFRATCCQSWPRFASSSPRGKQHLPYRKVIKGPDPPAGDLWFYWHIGPMCHILVGFSGLNGHKPSVSQSRSLGAGSVSAIVGKLEPAVPVLRPALLPRRVAMLPRSFVSFTQSSKASKYHVARNF